MNTKDIPVQMTKQETAEFIINAFLRHYDFKMAKQMAIESVDQRIETIKSSVLELQFDDHAVEYWEDVKEKMNGITKTT